jgi:hypothetical protein
MPALIGIGTAARANARAFLDWASGSVPSEHEQVRQALAFARTNADIVQALCQESNEATLVALSLLGEMRSPLSETCLRQFVRLPLPEIGTVVEGEILERTALATLQAKAIVGLAYLRSTSADAEVLRVVREHPSRVVRAAAIDAYLWNRSDSAQARATLLQYVRPDETIFIDRVRRESGESAVAFNRKLDNFLKLHPEVRPPAPQTTRPQ